MNIANKYCWRVVSCLLIDKTNTVISSWIIKLRNAKQQNEPRAKTLKIIFFVASHVIATTTPVSDHRFAESAASERPPAHLPRPHVTAPYLENRRVDFREWSRAHHCHACCCRHTVAPVFIWRHEAGAAHMRDDRRGNQQVIGVSRRSAPCTNWMEDSPAPFSFRTKHFCH